MFHPGSIPQLTRVSCVGYYSLLPAHLGPLLSPSVHLRLPTSANHLAYPPPFPFHPRFGFPHLSLLQPRAPTILRLPPRDSRTSSPPPSPPLLHLAIALQLQSDFSFLRLGHSAILPRPLKSAILSLHQAEFRFFKLVPSWLAPGPPSLPPLSLSFLSIKVETGMKQQDLGMLCACT